MLVEPPDCCLIHYGKREVLAHINAMGPEYEEVLAWVDPGPARPGTSGAGYSSTETAGPWGEGILIFGAVQPLKGHQTANLMADSYGFALAEELARVQEYIREHRGWQLEQVGVIYKRLITCH